MSTTTVLVIGAGIAGPVIALFLKERGYEPVLFEAHSSLADAGLSLALQPNGLKVLSLIPGLVEKLPGVNHVGICTISLVQNKILAFHEAYQKGNFTFRGVPRTEAHQMLVDLIEEKGVTIHWGHKLVSFSESEFSVEAVFENGRRYSGSFVIGCDGLHSGCRTALFGQEQPDYLGMTQMGGWSPVPEAFKDQSPRFYQFFAEGAHMVCYYCKEDTVSWVITRQEEERRETWKSLDEASVNSIKMSESANWPMGAGELVRTAAKYVKYGLYDRPALRSWHKGRIVLLGDAAHPTSPHLGQGANQAFEDIYHLLRQLKLHRISPANPISTADLELVFRDYENIRMPRSKTLVEGARAEGNKVRVVYGVEQCKARDQAVSETQGEEATLQRMRSYNSHPFQEISEI